MTLHDAIGYALLLGVVLAVVFGRRRGIRGRASADAAAFASGRASVQAEIAAAASSSVDIGGIIVHVSSGAGSESGASHLPLRADYDDRRDGSLVQLPVLRARELSDGLGGGNADSGRGDLSDATRFGGVEGLGHSRSVVTRRRRNGDSVPSRSA